MAKEIPQKQINDQGPMLENEMFSFRLILRSPEQMAAFYEGRGFPEPALEIIKQTCFVTAIFLNKSDKVIWLELKNWHFFADESGDENNSGDNEIKRLDRQYWQQQWGQINLPQASRSTFGWTLLPKSRDLQPDEPVGGNIILPKLAKPFTLKAYFVTGKNKRGAGINISFNNVSCAEDKIEEE